MPAEPLEIVTQALAHQPGVTDWQVQQHAERSAQLFLIGSKTETRRLVSTGYIQAQVYNDHPPRSTQAATPRLARGMTRRRLLNEEIADPARLSRALEEAVFIASLIDNPPYSLPTPPATGYPQVETADAALDGSDQARLNALSELRERLLAAVAAEPGVRLSSAELFATASDITLRNSRGIQAGRSETSLFCDLVLIASDGNQAAEYHTAPQRRRLSDLNIEQIVRHAAQYARDSLRVYPSPMHEGPVVISGEALVDLFPPLIFHSSARAAYQSLGRFSLGASICGEQPIRGDRLTFISNALLPYGQASAPFTDEGLPGERLVVIQEHHLQAWWAEQRYADYLRIRPTGRFANIEVPAGTHPLQEMLQSDGPLYHLVAFSWLRPDDLTGDFVAEIKLGYRLEHGQITPIKGGSLSGNLFDALSEMYLARETQFTGNYLGPEALRFGQLTISGT